MGAKKGKEKKIVDKKDEKKTEPVAVKIDEKKA